MRNEKSSPQPLLFGELRRADFIPAKLPRLRQWNTVEQVASYFQVSERTVRTWVDEEKLEAIKEGQTLRIAKQSIRMFIHRRKLSRPNEDEKSARRAAVAIGVAAIKNKLRDLIPEARSRHTRACEIWEAVASVVRANRERI